MPGPGRSPYQLVQRIVAANILAHGDQALSGHIEAGAMHGARFEMQRLLAVEEGDSLDDFLLRQPQCRGRDRRRLAHGLLDRFDAAKPAANGACHVAAA